MKLGRISFTLSLTFVLSSACAGSEALNNYKKLTIFNGNWVLSHTEIQEGGATKKGPAAELVGTGRTAISFKVVGKSSAVQENLHLQLPLSGSLIENRHISWDILKP